MFTVEMLEDDTGCDDGVYSKKYLRGEVYMISRSLAECFFDRKTAILFDEEGVESEAKVEAPSTDAEDDVEVVEGDAESEEDLVEPQQLVESEANVEAPRKSNAKKANKRK